VIKSGKCGYEAKKLKEEEKKRRTEGEKDFAYNTSIYFVLNLLRKNE